MNAKHKLNQKNILIFWLPLAATWFMMSVEGPYISALIARLAEPKFNLAAYGIAFSLALIIEAPVIMMMSASIALVKDYSSFQKLRTFNYLYTKRSFNSNDSFVRYSPVVLFYNRRLNWFT